MTKPPPPPPDAIDLDFTGVFNLKDLVKQAQEKAQATPTPPATAPAAPAPAATPVQAPAKAAAPPSAPQAKAPVKTAVPPPASAAAPAPAPATKPRPVPKEYLVGAKALSAKNYYVNMTRPRPARKVDPTKTTVLIVEDDTTTRNILGIILSRSEGYLIRNASDVKSFVAALQTKPLPDLVILDIELPGGVSGFKILAKIRAHPDIKKLPVIIFSGHTEPEDLEMGIELGVDAYLSKPAKADAILAAVKAVLGG